MSEAGLNFEFDETTRAIAAAVRERCEQFDDVYWTKCDSENRYPSEFVAAMHEGGWMGMTTDPKYGGGGQGHLQAAVALREIAELGAGINGCIPVHMTIFATASLQEFGSKSQKEIFLPKICSGELVICFAVTEPNAGSDTSKIVTKAEKTNAGWSVSGQKIWITQSLQAGAAGPLARTGPPESGRFDGLSLFLADLDPAHVDKRPIPKFPHNAAASCELFFRDLPVPNDRLIGSEGKGFRCILSSLNSERILMAAEMIGLGHAALRRAVDYANNREVFGRKIGANQAISHPLARAKAMLSAAWLVTLNGAWRIDQGLETGVLANEAKYLAAEACYAAADAAVQTYGGMGFAKEYHVERYFREARLVRVAPVSQEMTLNFLAQTGLGLPRVY